MSHLTDQRTTSAFEPIKYIEKLLILLNLFWEKKNSEAVIMSNHAPLFHSQKKKELGY